MPDSYLKARYIVTENQLLENGYLSVTDNNITGAIAELDTSSTDSVTDLGDVVVVPRLVNAHTHLEFSQLAEPISSDSTNFAGWIREVINWRVRRESEASSEANSMAAALRVGLEESHAGGGGLLGEILSLIHI